MVFGLLLFVFFFFLKKLMPSRIPDLLDLYSKVIALGADGTYRYYASFNCYRIKDMCIYLREHENVL